MEMGGQFHILSFIIMGKGLPVITKEEAGLTTELIWTQQ
jgi:hypothetical protein